MHFFIDQNINQQAPHALSAIYLRHHFDHAFRLGMHELKDEELFRELQRLGYDAIITKDRNQLRDPAERAGLRSAGLHWIGYNSKGHPGLTGIALETSTIVSGLPYVLEGLPPEPTMFKLSGIPSERTQRIKAEPI